MVVRQVRVSLGDVTNACFFEANIGSFEFLFSQNIASCSNSQDNMLTGCFLNSEKCY